MDIITYPNGERVTIPPRATVGTFEDALVMAEQEEDMHSVRMSKQTFWDIVNSSLMGNLNFVPMGIGSYATIYGLDVIKDMTVPYGEFIFSAQKVRRTQPRTNAHEYALKCSHCGAPNNGNDPSLCSYCGTNIPKKGDQ